MGVYLKGITEDDFKEISWESVYLALKRQDRIVEVKEPHGRLIDSDALLDKLRPRGMQEDFWKESSSYKDIANAPTIIERSE